MPARPEDAGTRLRWRPPDYGECSIIPPSLPKSPSGNSWLLPAAMQAAAYEAVRSPPVVTQALVAAAARILTPDSFANPRQLIRVDGAPVIIHLLRSLQASGIRRAVITRRPAAQLLAEEVRKHSFGEMCVELVWCEASSWKRGHASNILAARSMFRPGEPILLVMSDHIFDQRLLRRCCLAHVPPGCAMALIDDSDKMIEWAKPGGVHCQAHCKHGHCGSIVKVQKGLPADALHSPRGPPNHAYASSSAAARKAASPTIEQSPSSAASSSSPPFANGNGDALPKIARIGKKLQAFDAIDAGAFVIHTSLFDVLHRLLVESICTLAEAMQVLADDGKLSYVTVGELDWFGEQTVASSPHPTSQRRSRQSGARARWRCCASHRRTWWRFRGPVRP